MKTKKTTSTGTARDPSLGKGGRAVDRVAWDAIEAERNPDDLPHLFATLGTGTSKVAAERVTRLWKWKDPERLIPLMLRLFEKPPYTGGTSRKFWQTLIATMQESDDLAARDGMLALSKRYKSINGGFMGEWIAGAMNRAALKMNVGGAPLPTTAPQEKKKKAGGSAASLGKAFEAIVENPDDDDARLVYADMLSERGKKHGELIVLQVNRAAGRGSAALSDAERKKFIESGYIEDHLEAPLSAAAEGRIIFERGFPVEVELAKKGLNLVADAVEWGTVRKLSSLCFAPVRALMLFLDSDNARNIREVRSIDPEGMFGKLKKKTYPWTTLSTYLHGLGPKMIERLPALTTLEVAGDPDMTVDLFAAAPLLSSVKLTGGSAKLFAKSDALRSLTLDREVPLSDYAGMKPAIEHLNIREAPKKAKAWLKAFPSVTSLVLRGSTKIDWKDVAALFDAYPKLESVGLFYFDGIENGTIERGKKKDLTFVMPPGNRYPTYDQKIARFATDLHAIGVKTLKLYPEGPRHQREPMDSKLLAKIKKAWAPGKLELPELL